MNKSYHTIGLMSGSSLDGLDIAYCVFKKNGKHWEYTIPEAETWKFPDYLNSKLEKSSDLSSEALTKLDFRLGEFMGSSVDQFIKQHGLKNIDFVSSHGHTVFHNPAEHYTLQIGNGAAIAANSGVTTISDFRTLDVALGGQGAPLVPIGDQILFDKYTYCLNLGGYSNISFDDQGTRIAFDISPVNKVINFLANQLNKEIDFNGEIAKYGFINEELLTQLNNLGFYMKPHPKSLGDIWLKKEFLPIINASQISIPDKLRTVYEHIAIQINEATKKSANGTILATGGGAHNKFLMDCIRQHNHNEILLPEKKIIDFKEALIFAFMGVLRVENSINCLKSVTGARKDNSGGIIHQI